MVICPASVPVTVELCPAASRAIAKATGATRVPSSFSSRWLACWSSETTSPARQNDRRRHDKDRRVDEERPVHRHHASR